jgi:hypothetical protein
MALSKIDVANMLTGVTPVANGGTARTAMTGTPIQIVTAHKTDANTLSTSSSVADVANLTCAITPSATSSYVYVTANFVYQLYGNSASTTPHGQVQLLNNADTVLAKNQFYENLSNNAHSADGHGTLEAYYNPNTTSEISFNLAILASAGRILIYGDDQSYTTKPTQITVMEISA